jgi:hypothetical protein
MFGNVQADSRKTNTTTSAILVSSNSTTNQATTTVQNWKAPGYLFQSVVGYVPIDFLTNQADAVTPSFGFFNKVPDQINSNPASASSSSILLLPIGAKISGIYLTNNGVTVAGAGTVSISAIDIAAPATNPQALLAAVPIADLNTAGGLGKGLSGPPLNIALNITAAPYQLAVSEPALLTSTYGIAYQLSAATLTTGSLGVIVSYILPGNTFGNTNLL